MRRPQGFIRATADIPRVPTAFAALSTLCEQLAATSKRLEKRRLLGEFLRSLDPEEVAPSVLLLTAKILPESEQRALNVGWATLSKALEGPRQITLQEEPLTILAVKETFATIAATTGRDSVVRKRHLLQTLLGRASDQDRRWLLGSVFADMRIGVSEGVMLEAIADAASVPADLARTANMLAGDLGRVAAAALSRGGPALAGMALQLFTPIKPMMAELGEDAESILREHGGRTAVEYKFDGARIQIHRRGGEVRIFSRRLTDVTAGLPEIVEIALAFPANEFVVEGEVVAVDVAGRPLPFQDLMRRFRRVHEIEKLRREIPLELHLFDVLVRDGRVFLALPYEERWRELVNLSPPKFLAERKVVTAKDEIEAFFREALERGHEGLMAKALDSDYAVGKRGKKWFKLKPAETLDCVITAAEWGHGRRKGTLSNYHLAVKDGDSWRMIGKTFKGLTDGERAAITERLRGLAVKEHEWWVEVRPEIVVVVTYDEIQKSPTYASGFALRFARITRIREDKEPEHADTYELLKARYGDKFGRKGRADP